MPTLTLDQALELGELRKKEGKFGEAADIYRQILATFPKHALTMTRLGIVLGMADRLGEARDTFLKATIADPNFCPAWLNLSLAYERLEEFDKAIAARREAIRLHDNDAESWHRLGVCLGKSGQLTEAVQALRRCIELNPLETRARNDLCVALCKLGQGDAALESAQQGLALQPDNPAAMRVVAFCLKVCGHFDEATDVWRRLLESNPADDEARGQWAMCLLEQGDFERGWREYECRWRCESFSANVCRDVERQWGIPETVGKPDLAGRTILLYFEQGIGDTIQFIRYAPLLAGRGARVIAACQWPVKSLLEVCPGVRLAYGPTDRLPQYDWHIPMLSLPLLFGTTVQTIPAAVPYFKPHAAGVKTWQSRIESAAGKTLRVGLAWAGSRLHKNDANRSMDSKLLAPLSAVQGVTFFSLQKSLETPTPAAPPPGMPLIDHTSALCDFADTAAMILNLDLVISVDTAVAHLAGALAKPVWTLLSSVPDFRWMRDRPDTPWYPTMRLFRQKIFGQWSEVIESVARELQSKAR
jgi:tetratricopeptide (TPR) repeat protein